MSEDFKKAAYLAGNWWASRLNEKYLERQADFADEVTRLVDLVLLGEIAWEWESFERVGINGEKVTGSRTVKVKGNLWESQPECRTEFDYDPCPLLEDAIDAVFPGLDYFDKKQILPRKRELKIYQDKLIPKDGYGNWCDEILVT